MENRPCVYKDLMESNEKLKVRGRIMGKDNRCEYLNEI